MRDHGNVSERLAFGVTTGPGSRCWPLTPGDPACPVAVGPAGADPTDAATALAALAGLVADGGVQAAGAGVDLGGGFTSARLAGAPGDRRDAVLAALRVVDGERLGDRSSVLVALFGLSATKRVGAAAHTAISEGRWAALCLASAASDLLGPEQLERVLALRAPEGTDPFPRGDASTLARHLALVLDRYPKPRRLALVESLWRHVCDELAHRRDLAALADSQATDQLDGLRARHREHLDEPLLRQLGTGTTLAQAARWRPPRSWTAAELGRLLHDAIAATALLRFARTLAAEGLVVAARRHRAELVAADACLTDRERSDASDRSAAHPARPGRYLHDLLGPLRPGRTFTDRTERHVRQRVALARDYGVVVQDAVVGVLYGLDENDRLYECWDACRPWRSERLAQWRAAAGFTRSPWEWEQPPLPDAHPDGPKGTLAERLTPDADPVAAERPHDLLWLADLADALAPCFGHRTAEVTHRRLVPGLSHDPLVAPAPADPSADSVPLAAAGVAQLVAFGATPPPRCASWDALVEAVSADTALAEASVGAFPVPPELSTVDRMTLPGSSLVVELGRDPRQLAAWSGYMGNCIGDHWYADDARAGRCVLLALREGGRLVANVDLRRRGTGWHVEELRARFNDPVEPDLERAVTTWVAGLTAVVPEVTVVPEPPPVRATGGTRRPTGLPAELVRALTTAVEHELARPRVGAARRVYATLLDGDGDFDEQAAVVALKRTRPQRLAELVAAALERGVGPLWRASGVRPLAAAVASVPGRERLGALSGPLPRSSRTLVRRPAIAPAYAMDVVALAIRRAIGTADLAHAVASAVARDPTPELVCATVIAATCTESTVDVVRVTEPGATAVPGFPATDLFTDGPWRHALPAAAELGAPVEVFEQRVAEKGLLAPAALLGRGGWPALWARAHR